VCQTCLVKARRGAVPAAAQKGLKDGQRGQSLFLACLCRPTEDLEIERHGSSEAFAARIERVESLNEHVLRVYVSAPPGMSYRAGQFIQLVREDGLMRAYSIASLPGGSIELHVALLPGGAMSQWLRGAAGADVAVLGPFGECFYVPEEPERPLCLAGTGTGLSPLLGVVRAALAAGHRGPIRLYHGSPRHEGLYLWRELLELARTTPQLQLTGSVLEAGAAEAGVSRPGAVAAPAQRAQLRVGPIDDAVLSEGRSVEQDRVYLCGALDVVRKLQKKLYLAGVPLARIHADPFVAPGVRA
jgi:NAD(P)H-flavin reductase